MKRLLLLIVLLIASGVAFAQDPVFSQFINSRLLTNPAFAGLEPGLRFNPNYRALWRDIPNKFNTSAVTLEGALCRFPNVGLGLIVTHDVEGNGLLTTNEIGAVYSYKILGKTWSISAALQADMTFKNIDWSKFTFGDQLDPMLGVTGPSNAAAAYNENRYYPDFAAGLLFRKAISTRNKELYSHLGVAFHHLFQPGDGFLNSSGKLPLRVTVHAGVVVPIVDMGKKTRLNLVPMARYIGQDLNGSRHQQLDVLINLYTNSFFGGFGYKLNPRNEYFKNTDAAIICGGISGVLNRKTLYRITYSYDLNFKGVSAGNVGTHEITLVLSKESSCKGRRRYNAGKDCFDFAKKGLPKLF